MKSVVLLSGGLDSTYNLYVAREQTEIVLALTFDYGQRAARREAAHARRHCELLGLPHRLLELPWFREFTQTSLVNREAPVPQGETVQIERLSVSQQTATAVWVPNRNGIFLNIAAGFAEGLGAELVVPGFNLEEATTFADNSQDFMKALDTSFSFSTRNAVRTRCFSSHLSKTEIVRESQNLHVRFDLVWPCYLGEANPCGKCESCQRCERALQANGLSLSSYSNEGRPS